MVNWPQNIRSSPSRYARRAKRFGKSRIKIGLRRAYYSGVPAAQMTVCAIAAYAFAQYVLGHQNPIFAATASLISFGFNKVPRTRKVLEVSIGCTLGVAFGDFMNHLMGDGIWQAAVILFCSILIARFLDKGAVFAQQMGLQAALVVLLPQLPGGPFERSIDALIGGSFALVLTMILSVDPRQEPRRVFKPLLNAFSNSMDTIALALQEDDQEKAWKALSQTRNTDEKITSAKESIKSSREIARIAPAYRRIRHEIYSLAHSLKYIDYGIRNSRVYARRVASALGNQALNPSAQTRLGQITKEISQTIITMEHGLVEKDPKRREKALLKTQTRLLSLSQELHPENLGIETVEGIAVVTTLRPLIIDLLEATGMTREIARMELPDLD